MSKFLITIALISFCGCRNTPPKLAIKKQEQLNISFYPPFVIPCLLFNLKMEKDSGEVTYYVAEPRNPLTGMPPKTIVYDSIIIKVSGETYLKFAETIHEIDYKNYKIEEMDTYSYDGLNPSFQYISVSADTSRVNFESIKRRDAKVAYKLIYSFFEFTEILFKNDKKQKTYLKHFETYFDYKINE
jgi:hypothetical protein